jgi:ribosome-associated protein
MSSHSDGTRLPRVQKGLPCVYTRKVFGLDRACDTPGIAGAMIHISPDIVIPEEEIVLEFVRASGPGGQKVNKTATAVQLRFDVANSPSLPDDVRRRLIKVGGKRITDDGILILRARRHRTQERNRQDAIDRLRELIERASRRPKIRRRWKPSTSSKRRRLESKRRQGQKKRWRRPPQRDEWS